MIKLSGKVCFRYAEVQLVFDCHYLENSSLLRPKQTDVTSTLYFPRLVSVYFLSVHSQESPVLYSRMGHAVGSWLRQYATSPKVAGSIPEEVTGFFN
jgi:hypothetical protein